MATYSFKPDLERDLDRVRADLGDTDPSDASFSDEQIEAALADSSYDRALVTLGTQLLLQMPTRMQVVGLTVDMSGPIAALRSVIAAAQARLDAVAAAATPQQTPQIGRIWAGSDYRVR